MAEEEDFLSAELFEMYSGRKGKRACVWTEVWLLPMDR